VKVVPVQRVMSPADADKLVGRTVGDDEPWMPCEGPVLMMDADDPTLPVMAYLPLSDPGPLRQAVRSAKMTTTLRAGTGMRNASRTFGMAPRKPVQWREGCAETSLARDDPAVQAVLTDYAAICRDTLADLLPAEVERGKAVVGQVLPEWRLAEDALWTSGVINANSALPYHRDRFNFDAWSAMPVLRRGVRGGYLSVPEYGLTVPCRDGWALYWSGFRLLHGVTPLTKVAKDGYRFSVVYYALKGMKDCFTAAAELTYSQQKRTSREHAPAMPNDDGDPYGRVPE
jgi:hypothetical protein